MKLSKGWALTLGVFLGFQVARLQDKMPFVMKTLLDIRELVSIGVDSVPVVIYDSEDEAGGDED
jgi:hypothetical protein